MQCYSVRTTPMLDFQVLMLNSSAKDKFACKVDRERSVGKSKQRNITKYDKYSEKLNS